MLKFGVAVLAVVFAALAIAAAQANSDELIGRVLRDGTIILFDNASKPNKSKNKKTTKQAKPSGAVAKSAPSPVGFEVLNNHDIPGGDYISYRNATVDQCQAVCAQDNKCVAFTHNVTKGVCFLKSSAGGGAPFKGAISGIKQSGTNTAATKGKAKDGFVIYSNTDLPGGDGSIIDEKPGSLEACQLQCLFNDGCDAFTYNHNVNVCLGKSRRHIGGDRLSPTPFKGATSGMKASPQQVAAARRKINDSAPKFQEADVAWKEGDSAESFVGRVRTAARALGGECEVERQALSKLAGSVEVSPIIGQTAVGDSVKVDWSSKTHGEMVPSWLYVTADGPVRLSGKGFYALLPGAIAPFGIKQKQDSTRAIAALWGKDAPMTNSIEIHPLRSGALEVSVALVGFVRGCEEEFVKELASQTIAVEASQTPEFQVRDPYSFDRPSRTLISADGQTTLEIYSGRYRIVDAVTGATIADREGRAAEFSPTGRFVLVETGEWGREVVDAVDGARVYQTGESVVGWENSDSFILEGTSGWGALVVANPVKIEGSLSLEDGGCRRCSGFETGVNVDLENDVVMGYRKEGSGDAARLSGAQSRMKDPGGDARSNFGRFLTTQGTMAPSIFPDIWRFRGGPQYASGGFAGVTTQELADHYDKLIAEHHYVAKTKSSETHLANAEMRPLEIGQGRGAMALTRPVSASNNLLLRLGELGIGVSEALPAAFEKINPEGMDRNEALNYLQPEIADRIEKSVPRVKGVFERSRDTGGCNPDGTGPGGQERVFAIFDHAVEYRIGDRSLWLTSYMCAEGSAAFLYPNLHLFDSSNKEGFVRLDIPNPSNNVGPACGSNIAHCGFKVDLYENRLLLIWSQEARAVLLYDADANIPVFIAYDLPRGELLKDAYYSSSDNSIVQVNSDGSFYVHDVPSKTRVLEGRYIDDEVIVWTHDLRFDASPEGANYVNLRFPGHRGQYSFQQFSSKVKKPGLVREVLERRYIPSTRSLTLPPSISGRVNLEGSRLVGVATTSNASEIRVYQDGLLTDTLPTAPAQDQISIDVARVPSARWIALVAYSPDGLASLPFGTELAASPEDRPTVHALTVGIDRYDGAGLSSLRYAKRDATTLFDSIQAQDRKSLNIGNAVNLVDTEANPANILEAIKTMVADAKIGETIVFSFAGHGVTASNGEFYLATSNTEAGRVEETALAWSSLASILANAKARVVVFLDACHSGAAGTSLFATNDDAVDEVLQGVPSGLLVFSASKGRQFSEESPGAGGGLFTNAVADVIARKRQSHDLDGNGAIEISELYFGVKRQVSQQSEGRQVPWLARNELVGDFTLF